MNLPGIKYAYFLGIGGIGMSAIARYFHAMGIEVAGYDKTPSPLTDELVSEGINIHFDDDPTHIPGFVHAFAEQTLLIYTPAIPRDHRQFMQLLASGRTFLKRSEVLGLISRDAFCIAVAGTHGKTTTSTLIAHLLKEANINFTAFLGGISANYNTNYLHHTTGSNLFADKPVVVLEADEFDRSFHRLSPDIAVITAIDPDHLDIYGTPEAFREAFIEFTNRIKPGGTLIYNARLNEAWPAHINRFSYSIADEERADIHGTGIRTENGSFHFTFTSGINGSETPLQLTSGLPGFHNVENATAAAAVCLSLLNLPAGDISRGIASYRGAKRRFEYVVKSADYVVIDDYAHHPEELRAIISSVKALYPGKKVTGIFQPHLFSRTRDFADGFAESLSMLDVLVLMDIYPAREQPIPGITSSWLLDKVSLTEKQLLDPGSIYQKVRDEKPGVLLILGAGDIDRLVPVIKEIYHGF